MSAHDVIADGECIDCFMCKDVCPRDNITTNPKPALATGVSVLALGGLYYGGNLASSSLGNSTTVTQGQFSNGTFRYCFSLCVFEYSSRMFSHYWSGVFID
jgi:polyferredoxin